MENEKIRLGTNQPLQLDDPHHFWMVLSGEVDVFVVYVDEDGTYKSSLHYLYSTKKGELLFSLLTSPQATGYRLLLKSQGATLLAVNKNKLLDIDHLILKVLIEKWINQVVGSIYQENPPRVHQSLDTLNEIDLTKGKKAYPSKGIVWGLLEEGEVSKYGVDVEALPRQDLNFFFPISKKLWIRTLTEKARIKILSTALALKDEIFFMLAMNDLQDHLYGRMCQSVEDERERESIRMSSKARSEQFYLNDTLDRIRRIVNPTKKGRDLSFDISNRQVNSHLFSACQLIGEEVNFQFQAPKYLESYQSGTTNQLSAIAQASKVRVRKIILRGAWWKDENGHLLAFRKTDKRPLALIQKSPQLYMLRDPEDGTEKKVDHKVAGDLEPIAYMFFYGFHDQMTSFKRIVHFAMKGVKSDARFLIMAAFAGSLIGLLVPILSGIMFDDVIPSADKSMHIQVFIIMLLIAFITAGLQLVRGVLILRVETKSSINMQAGVMDHLLRLPVAFYKNYSAGDLTDRALSINTIRQILSNTVLTGVLSGAFSFVNLALLFYYDASLAWIGVGLAFVAILFVLAIGWMKLKYDREISEVQGNIKGFLFEFLSGINKIRNTAGEKRIFTLWAGRFSRLKQLAFDSGNYQNFVETFNSSYPLFTMIFFFGFIYYSFTNGTTNSLISVGAFIAFISAFNQFLGDALKMSLTLISSLNIVPLYERVKPILDEVPESNEESADPGELAGEIEMNSVSFRYFEDQPLILKDVSFRVAPGEMVAFVGPSGSGKSTIMRLLLGFEEAESGSIYYDGETFESMNKDLVRRQIGVVLQNGALMSGSIYQNIVGNSELTLEDAWEAARLAGMEEDIKQMPMEMHTVVSGGGGTFSGGQRQRLMIARAIVHKPRLIFMDEATSALDNRTQNIVSQSLEKLQASRIVIAHRLSTIEKADRIYVLDKGEIVEFGSYEELMALEGTFSKLAKRQIA